MRQSLVKEGQDANYSAVERQALHAVHAKSYVRGEWARMRSPMLLSLGYLIGWYWRV